MFILVRKSGVLVRIPKLAVCRFLILVSMFSVCCLPVLSNWPVRMMFPMGSSIETKPFACVLLYNASMCMLLYVFDLYAMLLISPLTTKYFGMSPEICMLAAMSPKSLLPVNSFILNCLVKIDNVVFCDCLCALILIFPTSE